MSMGNAHDEDQPLRPVSTCSPTLLLRLVAVWLYSTSTRHAHLVTALLLQSRYRFRYRRRLGGGGPVNEGHRDQHEYAEEKHTRRYKLERVRTSQPRFSHLLQLSVRRFFSFVDLFDLRFSISDLLSRLCRGSEKQDGGQTRLLVESGHTVGGLKFIQNPSVNCAREDAQTKTCKDRRSLQPRNIGKSGSGADSGDGTRGESYDPEYIFIFSINEVTNLLRCLLFKIEKALAPRITSCTSTFSSGDNSAMPNTLPFTSGWTNYTLSTFWRRGLNRRICT